MKRRAQFFRNDFDELFFPFFISGGDMVEQFDPFFPRRFGKRRKRFLCRLHRAVNVLWSAICDLPDHFFGGGIDDVQPFVPGRLDESAINVMFRLYAHTYPSSDIFWLSL